MRTRGILALALAGLMVAACGGGGGTAAQNASLGSVALLLAEDRTDAEPTSVSATIAEVALVPRGGGPRVVLFGNAPGEEVDLSREDLLVSVSDIRPGQYDTVSVALSGVRFEGADCADIDAVLPSGDITVVPDKALVVAGGNTLSLRLSIDVDKSMDHGSGVCTFRPVFRVSVGAHHRRSYGDGDCPSTVTGTVKEVSEDGTGGVLQTGKKCDLEFLIDENTAIFDADGELSDGSVIAEGEDLTIKGYLNEDHQLVALVIVVGQVLAVEGKVDSAFDADTGTFTLLPDDDEEVVGALDVSVVDGTLIVFDCAEGSTDDINVGGRLIATGKLDTESGALRAISIEIGPNELVGQLTAIEETEGGFNITLEVEGEEEARTIFVGEDVDIHIEGDGTIPSDLLAALLDCESLTAKVSFAADDPTLVVDVSIKESQIDGKVADLDASSGLMTLDDGTVVQVLSDATILDLKGDDGLIPLSDVAVGDRVRVFGLEACGEDEDADFYGFVVLVCPEKKWDKDGKDEDHHHKKKK